jgi:hypothetical protein
LTPRKKKKGIYSTVGYSDGSPFDNAPPDVVLVGPDRAWRNTLRARLEQLGYRALAIDRGAELLRLSRQIVPRLVMGKLEGGGEAVIGIVNTLYGDRRPAVLLTYDSDPPSQAPLGAHLLRAGDTAAILTEVVERLGTPRRDDDDVV